MSYVTKSITAAILAKNIKSIKTRGVTMDKLINETAVQCLIQIDMHGNTTPAGNLIKALPHSTNRSALMKWMLDLAPLVAKFKGKSKQFENFKVDKSETANALDIVKAEQVPFWNYKADVTAQVYGLDEATKSLENLLKKVSKNLSDSDMTKFIEQLHSVKEVTEVTTVEETGTAVIPLQAPVSKAQKPAQAKAA